LAGLVRETFLSKTEHAGYYIVGFLVIFERVSFVLGINGKKDLQETFPVFLGYD